MKRELLENVKVQPYTSGDAIDREGYLSAVLGVSLGAATGTPTGITVKVTFTECDTEGGSYTPVADKLVVPGKTTDDTGAVTIGVVPLCTNVASLSATFFFSGCAHGAMTASGSFSTAFLFFPSLLMDCLSSYLLGNLADFLSAK